MVKGCVVLLSYIINEKCCIHYENISRTAILLHLGCWPWRIWWKNFPHQKQMSILTSDCSSALCQPNVFLLVFCRTVSKSLTSRQRVWEQMFDERLVNYSLRHLRLMVSNFLPLTATMTFCWSTKTHDFPIKRHRFISFIINLYDQQMLT